MQAAEGREDLTELTEKLRKVCGERRARSAFVANVAELRQQASIVRASMLTRKSTRTHLSVSKSERKAARKQMQVEEWQNVHLPGCQVNPKA